MVRLNRRIREGATDRTALHMIVKKMVAPGRYGWGPRAHCKYTFHGGAVDGRAVHWVKDWG